MKEYGRLEEKAGGALGTWGCQDCQWVSWDPVKVTGQAESIALCSRQDQADWEAKGGSWAIFTQGSPHLSQSLRE